MEPRTVAVTGASGLVGRELVRSLTCDGIRVLRLVRGDRRTEDSVPWDPLGGAVETDRLAGTGGVVHLAGEPVVRRWTRRRMEAIRRSRVEGTRTLATALAAMDPPPRVLVCASGIDYYGDTGDRVVTEDTPSGTGFLAEVGRQWEAAADPARAAGIRVVHLRSGPVLAREGGMLGKMLLPFRLGLGGRIGNGRQWMGWISRHDLVRLIRFALGREEMSGAYNAVAPGAVTNREFTATLGRVLRRPTPFPVPTLALRALFGPGVEMITASHRVQPQRLASTGFVFHHEDLESALRAELGRERGG